MVRQQGERGVWSERRHERWVRAQAQVDHCIATLEGGNARAEDRVQYRQGIERAEIVQGVPEAVGEVRVPGVVVRVGVT
jgi:hypothetical protein